MSKNISFREEQKIEAVKRMKKLSLHPNVINEFITEDKINKSEICGILYWLNDEEEKFVKAFEKEHNAVVYHIIKSYTNIGAFLTVLYVSQYRDEWEEDYNLIDENIQVCYVKNLSDDLCSEFGYISLRCQIGGLVRVS